MHVCTYEKCGKETKSLIKGLCPTCYARYQRNGTAEHVRPERSLGVRECSYCSSTQGPFIKSLCRACYQRQYKNGTPEMQKVRHLCKQPGCDGVVAAYGLCQTHAQRVRRHGSVDAGRPEGWGAKSKHPMYEGWQSMRRISSRPGSVGRDPKWDDFWVYLADVGERPHPSSRLYLIDPSQPYSGVNCEWRESILDGSVRGRNAEYQKAYRERHPDREKRAYLWRHYKITLEAYEEMLAHQKGGCAICGRSETNRHHKTGELMLLAVDHHHGPAKTIRGLLCANHNRALGMFGDDPNLLRAAIAYLEKHKSLE
jgi:Recombination endonuclease VII